MKAKEIIEAIEKMSANELVNLNNLYCQEFRYDDNEIFDNDEYFFNMFFEGKPMEVARATFYGDYNFSHDFVKFNGYGNLESIQYMSTDMLVDSIEVMAQSIEENFEAFEDLF